MDNADGAIGSKSHSEDKEDEYEPSNAKDVAAVIACNNENEEEG